jgi:CIC family chloride channel protein
MKVFGMAGISRILKDVTHELRSKMFFKMELLATFIGVVGGLGAVVFREMIDINHEIFFGSILPFLSQHLPQGDYNPAYILIPALGGLIVGPIIFAVSYETKGHGVPEVMEAVHLKGGRIRKRVAFVKIVVSSITIGTGGSAGREGPIAQIGASVGSFMGQLFKLPEKDLRLLVVCGLAAGIAGTFNAPLGGALFGMEVMLRRFAPLNAMPLLISGVLGAAVASLFLGTTPSFEAPNFIFPSLQELFLYLLLGIAFGVISFLWVKVFYAVEDAFNVSLPIPPRFRPVVGGLLTGTLGMLYPGYGIMGVGYEGVNLALSGAIPLTMMLTLGVFKILATSFTIGSGASGGIFAPSLYIGSMLGGAMGLFFQGMFPDTVSQPAAFGLVGMGALFAGAAKAPITVIIFIPEMANNYSLLVPLMISCSTSYIISSLFLRESSIYTLKLERRGVHLKERRGVLDKVRVGDAMCKDVVTVGPGMSLTELMEHISRYRHVGYPVLAQDSLAGIITLDDVVKVPVDERDRLTVGDIMKTGVVVAHPEETVGEALDRMYQNAIGRLPVVDSDNPLKLLGIITRSDVVKAYEIGKGREGNF